MKFEQKSSDEDIIETIKKNWETHQKPDFGIQEG